MRPERALLGLVEARCRERAGRLCLESNRLGAVGLDREQPLVLAARHPDRLRPELKRRRAAVADEGRPGDLLDLLLGVVPRKASVRWRVSGRIARSAGSVSASVCQETSASRTASGISSATNSRALGVPSLSLGMATT